MPAKPIPPGYHSLTPYIIVRDAAAAIEFYKQAFSATELMRLAGPGGKLGHAEIKIGDSTVMMADEFPDRGHLSPQTLGGTSFGMLMYVDDVDARYQQAIAAGAKSLRPVQDQFYGDRSGTVMDPYGHMWTIATHKEDLSMEEIQRRAEEFTKRHSTSTSN